MLHNPSLYESMHNLIQSSTNAKSIFEAIDLVSEVNLWGGKWNYYIVTNLCILIRLCQRSSHK